jgi:hypothetical protein
MRLVRTEYWNPSTGTVRTGSTGHGESLADIETYLLPLTGALYDGAFGYGVTNGLEVTAGVGQQSLTVSTGLAVDGNGQPIVLSDGGAAVVDPNAPPGQVQNVPLVFVGTDGVELPTSGLTGAQVLTATAREALDGTAGAASWSLVHAPWLVLVPATSFTDDGTRVPLAAVTLDANGAVTALDAGPRRQVSPTFGSLTLGHVDVADGQTASVGAAAGPSLQSRQDGGLDVMLPGPQPGAALTVEGASGRVGIGTGSDPLAARLQVGGAAHSGGADAGLSFMDREVTGYVDAPIAGERWVWYADHGYARLWSGTDQLSVGAPGDGGGLDVPRRMRVRQGGDISAGIWFSQNAAPGAAFVGMSDDDHVGFWGHDAGWGLTMDVHSGALSTSAPLTVHAPAVVVGNLRAGGGLTLPEGGIIQSDGRLHITGPELLFLLNHDGVVVGKEWGGSGNLTVEGTLRTGANVSLPSSGIIQSDGRLHVTGPELLFLLNHDGVVIGREWGGNGNLTVEGSLTVRGAPVNPIQSGSESLPPFPGPGPDQAVLWGTPPHDVYRKRVNFAAAFSNQPKVTTSLASLDAHHGYNTRIATDAQNISQTGFDLVIVTWGDTRVYGASVRWLAF